VTTAPTRPRVYTHALLQVLDGDRPRWSIGYLAEPATEPGTIRVSPLGAHQIASDLLGLRNDALNDAAQTAASLADALATVNARLPRITVVGDSIVADWRDVRGDSGAFLLTHPDPDGGYTLDLGLDWQLVDPDLCYRIRNNTAWPPPAATAYQAYVAGFANPVDAVGDLAERAGVAVAYLDRAAIEECSRTLSDDEWSLIRGELHQYDQYISADDNDLFLDQIFSDAGLERYRDADATDTTTT
jgi:hypothetical protein